jgi:hypothetical protein
LFVLYDRNKLAVRQRDIWRRIIWLMAAIANQLGRQLRGEIAMIVDRITPQRSPCRKHDPSDRYDG